MPGYNWTWPQISSLTAMKYQRHGYVEVRPFEIGERHSGRRNLEKYVKGYRYPGYLLVAFYPFGLIVTGSSEGTLTELGRISFAQKSELLTFLKTTSLRLSSTNLL